MLQEGRVMRGYGRCCKTRGITHVTTQKVSHMRGMIDVATRGMVVVATPEV